MGNPQVAIAGSASSQRHYGLDWLRIAAFALLILYHIGMAFAPWQWVIHTEYSFQALIVPMALLTPWRLPLLFAVSGYASRKLFEKSGSAGDFAQSRAKRLLIPLGFGMAVLVPIEMWVLVMEGGYAQSFAHFWAFDYLRWGQFHGREFPSWEHLWFVAYLAAYTFVLAGLLAWRGKAVFAALDRIAAWLAHGYRILWAPAGLLIALKLALLFVVPERQGLLRDWSGHAQFFPVFLFGFMLAGAPSLWPALARAWRPALLVAAIAGAVDVAMELRYPGTTPIPHAMMALDRTARIAMGWMMIPVLFHLAQRWWNHDHPWRKTLAEAVFPFYIIHHPVIVLIAWYTLPLHLSALAEFALLLSGTSAACLAFYLIGRDVNWLRPFIGLAPRPRGPRTALAPVA